VNLKESFRYQNYLETLFNYAVSSLTQRSNITTTTQLHQRSKANPEAVDETVVVEVEKRYTCTNDQLIEFMCAIIDEKRAVAIAIHKAKAANPFACDAEVSVNRCTQRAAKILSDLGSMKQSSERIYKSTDYKFNAEGNQVPYNYDVKETVCLDFDPANAKKLAKKLFDAADFISSEADRALIETEIAHEPFYDVNEGFDDAVVRFLSHGK